MGQLFGQLDPQGPMLRVREGMTVYDRADKRIGTVKEIHLGDGSEQAQGTGVAPATAGEIPERRSSILEDLGVGLDQRDNLPEGARDHLLRVGYIAIDAIGIFTGERFATAEQVAEAGEDRVVLNIEDDELIRR